jgi:hypothetical protein
MSIRNRIEDAEFLWQHGRLEGAFLLALVAVAATSKRLHPNDGDRQAFESFLRQGVFERISVEFRGQLHPVYHIFYKWLRCELVHEGGVPMDIEFMPDTKPGTVAIRAGGAPEYLLKVSHGWFRELVHVVKTAPVNAGLF